MDIGSTLGGTYFTAVPRDVDNHRFLRRPIVRNSAHSISTSLSHSETADTMMIEHPNACPMKLLLLLLLVVTVTPASLRLPISLTAPSSMLNLTANSLQIPHVPVDPRFGLRSTYSENIPIDEKGLLVTAVITMARLATKDFNRQIGSFQSIPATTPSRVSLRFYVTAPGGQVDTKIAVWAGYTSVLAMAQGNQYKEAKHEIYWDHARVAILRIVPTAPSQGTLEQRSDSLQNHSGSLPHLQLPANDSATRQTEIPGTVNGTNILTSGEFEIACLDLDHGPEVLSVSEVLGPVMSVLKNVAAESGNNRVDGSFITRAPRIDTKVVFLGNDIDPDHPSYRYKYVIRALRDMTLWLVDRGRLGEVVCGLIVDRQYVGGVLLGKQSRPD